MSAITPKATKSLRRTKGRAGPQADIPSVGRATVKYVTDLQCEA